MKHGSLFSGIGGFDLAAEWMGWTNIFHCENNPFCQQVLKHYWPDAASYGDIKATDFTIWRGRVDILTGGFPCQPFSTAGKRKGGEDDRYLWPEMLRAIREIKPQWIVAENVPGLLTCENGMAFQRVYTEMEAEGYEAQPVIIPACSVDAPHKRDRLWFVAHSISNGCNGNTELKEVNNRGLQKRVEQGHEFDAQVDDAANTKGQRCGKEGKHIVRQEERDARSDKQFITDANHKGLEERESVIENDAKKFQTPIGATWGEHWHKAATKLCILDDGLSDRLDGITLSKWRTESLKAAGNAIVPQVAYEIFKAIE